MQKIDVIILANSSNEYNINMTFRTLMTLKDSEADYEFHVHLVESGQNFFHRYVSTGIVSSYVQPNEKFNYNKFVNIGLSAATNDWVIISNNDVSYEKNWLSEIMAVHTVRPDIHSFSPKDPLLYARYFPFSFIGSNSFYLESYNVHEAIMGWCLVIKKESLDLIRPFDEQFDMYYQDNDYGEMLKIHGIKHALVRYSIAGHLNTLNILELTEQKRIKMPIDELKFRNKWKLYK